MTLKQQLFVEAYLANGGNATEAARMAGYKGSDDTLRVTASRMLTNANVAAAVGIKVARLAMEADEVLELLTQHARASMDDFTTLERTTRDIRDPETGEVTGQQVYEYVRVDLVKAKRKRKMHLVTSIKETQHGNEIKLVDAQAAAVQLGKYHGFFTDKLVIHQHAGRYVGELLEDVDAVLREFITDDDQYTRAVDALQSRLESRVSGSSASPLGNTPEA